MDVSTLRWKPLSMKLMKWESTLTVLEQQVAANFDHVDEKTIALTVLCQQVGALLKYMETEEFGKLEDDSDGMDVESLVSDNLGESGGGNVGH